MGTGQNRKREVGRVTLVGLIINVCLIGTKIVGGMLGRSQAVLADGVHSGGDLITDIIILIGLSFWARPKDRDHPYGHERIETLVTLVLSTILLGAGVFLALNAASGLRHRHLTYVRPVALYAALISVASKEILYRWTRSAGTRMKSLAVVANAWHHRADALSSIPVAIAVLVAILFPAWWFIDHLAAIVVSIFIMHAAYGIALPCIRQLIDTAPPGEVRGGLREAIRSTGGVVSVHGVKARYLGSKILAEAHVEVDGSVTVEEGHGIAEEVKKNVFRQFPEIEDITIHIEPAGDFAVKGEP
ncbi:MAG: cation diffusion facilitator family transporter [bacterium]